VNARAHDLLGVRALDLGVLNAGVLLPPIDGWRLVQPVVGAQVEEEDVLPGVDALLLDLLEDGVLSAADGLVLIVHDGAGARRGVVAQVAGEAGDGGNENDDAELAALLAGPDDGVDDGAADGVVDGRLLVARRRDEELVLNVHKVLGLADDLAVGVLDRVVRQDAAGPVGAGAHDLGMQRPPVLEVAQAALVERVGDVLAHGVFGALDADEVLVIGQPAAQLDPVEAVVALVLVA